jgi:hypothetical protein
VAIWIWLLIAIGIVVVVGLVLALSRQRRSSGLREQFGSEYDRTIDMRQNRRAAETELRDRAKQRARIELHPLTQASRDRYTSEWANVQAQFVDQPTDAVRSADGLVHRVMNERGYPMDNFDDEADLISVDHPDVVDNFRSAHGVFLQAQNQQATTEDLRSAMLHYRSLFDKLLVSDALPSNDFHPDTEALESDPNRQPLPQPTPGHLISDQSAVDTATERPRS